MVSSLLHKSAEKMVCCNEISQLVLQSAKDQSTFFMFSPASVIRRARTHPN